MAVARKKCVPKVRKIFPKPRPSCETVTPSPLAQPVTPTPQFIQLKLRVGAVNDPLEREADRMAETVMRMSDVDEEEETIQAKAMPGQTPEIQRMCPGFGEESVQRQEDSPEEEDLEGDEELQAKSKPGETPAVIPGLESRISSMKGGGQPLNATARAFFEPRFGHDFSQVRVHTDKAAADTAKAIHARAFTLGNHVVMGSGEYQPNSPSGQRLLGHELTHVVQQGDLVNPTLQRSPDSVKSASHEIYCHEPKFISSFSDKKLVREMSKIKAGTTKGVCVNKYGTEKEYYRDLEIEALGRGRGLLTHPTGITSTTASTNSLGYGTGFTHTLKISPGGKSRHLKDSEIKEDLLLVRDDFNLKNKPVEATWTLGKTPGSKTPSTFIDSIMTPEQLIKGVCTHGYVNAIPPVREELQQFKWRKFSKEKWEPPFYTNRIIFKLVQDRHGRYQAVTITNGVAHREGYYGAPPPKVKP